MPDTSCFATYTGLTAGTRPPKPGNTTPSAFVVPRASSPFIASAGGAAGVSSDFGKAVWVATAVPSGRPGAPGG